MATAPAAPATNVATLIGPLGRAVSAGGSGAACAGSGAGGGSDGGGISVAVRSMVGTARFLRRGPAAASCGAFCCASGGVSGVVGLSAMLILSESATRMQEITQMAQRRQSTLRRLQKSEQRRLVRPLGHGDAAGAGPGQRLGDRPRQAKMPHLKRLFDNARLEKCST